MSNIIAISGRSQSGKDFVAREIKRLHPEYEIVRFGDALKEIYSIISGISVKMLQGQYCKQATSPSIFWSNCFEYGIKPYKASRKIRKGFIKTIKPTNREMLQFIGTDLFRNEFNKDIWIDILLNRLKPEGKYIITDLRFENEFERLSNLSTFFIKINRDLSQIYKNDLKLNNFKNADLVLLNDDKFIDLVKINSENNCEANNIYNKIMHESEQFLLPDSNFNLILDNNKSKSELIKQITQIFG